MYKVEVDQTLCQIMAIYRRVGIWRSEGESDFRSSCMRILYFLHYFGLSFYILTGAFYGYVNDDMGQLIFLVAAEIAVVVITVKLAFLIWRKDKILKFLYDPILSHCTKNYDESVEVDDKIKKITVLNKVYFRFIFFNLIFMIVLPSKQFTDGDKMIPGFIHFDLDSDYEMVLYWMAYLYGSVGCFCSVVYSFASIFIWYIVYNYSIEYKLLCQRFRSLGHTIPNTYQQELINLIRAHRNLFE